MTVLSPDGCRCARTGRRTDNGRAFGCWLSAAARAATPARMRVRADGNARVPPSTAWHRCLTVQLRA